MNRKRIFSIVLMAFMFLSISFAVPDMTRSIRGDESYAVAMAAAPRSSSGGFKSGSFKSSGGFSSGFKSGSFFNSKRSSSSWFGGSSWSTGSSRRTWIKVPWIFGRNYGFSPLYLLFGSLGSIIRLIIILAIIYYIVRFLRRR